MSEPTPKPDSALICPQCQRKVGLLVSQGHDGPKMCMICLPPGGFHVRIPDPAPGIYPLTPEQRQQWLDGRTPWSLPDANPKDDIQAAVARSWDQLSGPA